MADSADRKPSASVLLSRSLATAAERREFFTTIISTGSTYYDIGLTHRCMDLYSGYAIDRLGMLLYCGSTGCYLSHADQRAATTLSAKPHNGGAAPEKTVLILLTDLGSDRRRPRS